MSMQLIRRRAFATWKGIPEVPKDPILYFNQLYVKDTNPKKANLSVGAYADDQGKAWILTSAQMAIQKLLSNKTLTFSYLPINGDPEFLEESVKMAYGLNTPVAASIPLANIARTQTLSGTGGIFMAFNFVKEFYADYNGKVYTPAPTWPIHNTLAKTLGMDVQSYHYYDLKERRFDFDTYFNALKKIPEKSFVVFHSTGHNPTGYDPRDDQWDQIVDLASEKNFLVLMDTAYQGFVSGDLEKDGRPIRLMAEKRIKMLVVQSFAKNMGLYGQRTGCLSIPCENEQVAAKIQSYLAFKNRNVFSNPPRFGSDIAKLLLKDPEINAQWHKDIKAMAHSIEDRRKMLHATLIKVGCKDNWDYILEQRGMFAFTHLQLPQIQQLREKYAVYMTEDGRISITGLNPGNVQYVAEAITAVSNNTK